MADKELQNVLYEFKSNENYNKKNIKLETELSKKLWWESLFGLNGLKYLMLEILWHF